MKAIILAAGEGKRLRPYTETIPKCMISVCGRSIIDYQIDNLLAAGITESVVVTGYKAEVLMEYLKSSHPAMRFTFVQNPEYEKTYPAYGLYVAKEYFNTEFLYLNADVICHPTIITKILESKYPTVTAIQDSDWEEEEVNVMIDNDTNEILEIGKHINAQLSVGEFIGVTKISGTFIPELLRVLQHFVEKQELKRFAADALNLTIQRSQKMYALNVSDLPAIEIDTPADLAMAEEKVATALIENHA